LLKPWPPELQPPESSVCSDAFSLSAQVSPPFLLNHAVRTFAWGCVIAHHEHLAFDRELFYVASLLHDVGLTEAFDGPRCFELQSGEAARRFARERGWDADRCDLLGEAIRLHMQPRVVLEDGVEAYLLDQATSLDVVGNGLDDVDGKYVEVILSLSPREGFKSGFLELLVAQARAKPGCMADIAMRGGLGERMQAAPFDS
jgi:hypothetical protein